MDYQIISITFLLEPNDPKNANDFSTAVTITNVVCNVIFHNIT